MTTHDDKPSDLSRRDFLKISSIAASVPLVTGPRVIEVGGQEVAVHGPGPVPVTLSVNGHRFNANLEPRVTLLDALREHFDVTGPKRVCDRAECGACTVLIDNRLVYSCENCSGHGASCIAWVRSLRCRGFRKKPHRQLQARKSTSTRRPRLAKLRSAELDR